MIYEHLARMTGKNEWLNEVTAKLVATGTAVAMISLNKNGEIKYEVLDNARVRIDPPGEQRMNFRTGNPAIVDAIIEKLSESGITAGIEEYAPDIELRPFDPEPCQAADFDSQYRGKCKKLRREARGW